ncbi:MAG: MBOAT family protein [Candidatus Tectimicrobiota bacterium]
MSFTDYPYYLCIIILLLLLLFVNKKHHWVFLLSFSIIFYGYKHWEYMLLLLISVSIDYICSIKIENSASVEKQRLLLITSLISNLGILFFFKYFPELYAKWSWIEYHKGIIGIGNIALPPGISFYTLQSIGYTIDVYRKTVKAERYFGYFLLYVCFFPQLIAGPIERPQKLIPQLRNPATINIPYIQSGLFLIGIGLFKKLVIADRIFIILNDTLSSENNMLGWQAWVFGTLAFLAVYIDMSAYTDIARGSARLFGIELSINFYRPMLSLSLGEFWQRWHISLSSWIMSYLFKPLVQLNPSRFHRHLSLIITFLIIGLWHGPTIPFILMGGLHGCAIVLERITVYKWPQTKFFNILRFIRTHLLINVSGVLFLSPTIEVAMKIYANMFYFDEFINISSLKTQLHGYTFSFILFISPLLLIILESQHRLIETREIFSEKIILRNFIIIYIIIFISIGLGARKANDFLYFFF